MKKVIQNIKFKILAPTWNDKSELPNGPYSVSNISDILIHVRYFDYIIKNHETLADYTPIKIYVNKVENKITFKTKTGYYLELLTPETMKLLGSTKNK